MVYEVYEEDICIGECKTKKEVKELIDNRINEVFNVYKVKNIGKSNEESIEIAIEKASVKLSNKGE